MVYLASYFSLNQEFGFYMVMAVLGGMLGDLVLLPAMLAAFPAMVKNRNKASVVALESVRKPVDSSDQERLVA
jgi:hypothetical protein